MRTIITIEDGKVTVQVDQQDPVTVRPTTILPGTPIVQRSDVPAPGEIRIFIPDETTPPEHHESKPAPVITPKSAENDTVRRCPICNDEIPAFAHKLKKLCGKKECLNEQQRQSSRKSYHKLLGHSKPTARTCECCGDDISDLRGNRTVCEKPDCLQWRKRRAANKWARENSGRPAVALPGRPQMPETSKSASEAAAVPPAAIKPPTEPQFLPGYEKSPEEIEKWRPKPPKPPKPAKHPGYEDIHNKPDDAEWWCVHCKRWGSHRSPDCIAVDYEHPAAQQREAGDPFTDPWNCQLCRTEQHLCPMHASMTKDGQTPPVKAGRPPEN